MLVSNDQKPVICCKQEKHNSIRSSSQAKSDSINDAISQAIQDENISHVEFHKILQKIKQCCKLKE